MYCKKCYIELQHQDFINNIPLSRDELQELLLNNKGNFTQVSKQFGINTTKLRRWCKELNLSPYSDSYKPQKTEKKTIKDFQKSVRMLDKNTLEENINADNDSIALIACRVENVRLIDNIYLGE